MPRTIIRSSSLRKHGLQDTLPYHNIDEGGDFLDDGDYQLTFLDYMLDLKEDVLIFFSNITYENLKLAMFDHVLFAFTIYALVGRDIETLRGDRQAGLDALVDSFGGANNNLVKAGRVVRLVRLVRLIRLFRIALERRKRKRLENEINQLVEYGIIAKDEALKEKLLNDHRIIQLALQQQ
eukprot:scaffold310_cov174-Ochromonas_danica.AAC.5